MTLRAGYGSRNTNGSVSLQTLGAGTSGVRGALVISSDAATSRSSGAMLIGTGASNGGRGGSFDLTLGSGNSGAGGNVGVLAGESRKPQEKVLRSCTCCIHQS